ncbi:uncharacterized protein LOC124116287 [Haliotis rufescens]|uniref:uncharacterized protein LOC124116287 n=1 Tax=Haliotis rufescens TaxID=6454 RepID=UPI001EB02015|nr:uncharacterized protein LOC124116287 [Haliotis rufescens]
MDVLLVFAVLTSLSSVSTLNSLMKTSDGKVDLDSVVTHVLLLEKTVSSLTTSLARALSSQTWILKQTVSNNTHCGKSDLDSLTSKVYNLNVSIISAKSELSSALEQLRKPRNLFVSYQVKEKAETITVQNKEILKFNTITENKGRGYHAASGIFEAPVSGTYLFWATIKSGDSGTLFINLIKEGVTLYTGYSSRQLSYGVATLIYVVSVNKGEKVWFTKPGETLKIWGLFQSSYGGVLLHAS